MTSTHKLLWQSHPNIYFWRSINKPELISCVCEETILIYLQVFHTKCLRYTLVQFFPYSSPPPSQRCSNSVRTVGFRGTTSYPSKMESCQVRRTRGQYVPHAQSIYQEAMRWGRQGLTCWNVMVCYHVEKSKCHECDGEGLAPGYCPA
jgi:hypothetical protein